MGCVQGRNVRLEYLRFAVLDGDIRYINSIEVKTTPLIDATHVINETVSRKTNLETLNALIKVFGCYSYCVYRKFGPERITLDIISSDKNDLEEYQMVANATTNSEVFDYCVKRIFDRYILFPSSYFINDMVHDVEKCRNPSFIPILKKYQKHANHCISNGIITNYDSYKSMIEESFVLPKYEELYSYKSEERNGN